MSRFKEMPKERFVGQLQLEEFKNRCIELSKGLCDNYNDIWSEVSDIRDYIDYNDHTKELERRTEEFMRITPFFSLHEYE